MATPADIGARDDQHQRRIEAAVFTEQDLSDLTALHAAVSESAAAIAARHGARLQCRLGCTGCCVDELTVFSVEAERIRRAAPTLLAEGTPAPVGRCAMLDDEGACRIYAARPYVCRTQGLPLRYFDDDDFGGVVELRDICPLNDPGPPIESLDPADCWTIGSTEAALSAIQARRAPGVRVALRDLFEARR